MILLGETLGSPWNEAPATAATNFRSDDLAMQRSGDHQILVTVKLGDHEILVRDPSLLVPGSVFKVAQLNQHLCFPTLFIHSVFDPLES